MHPPPAAPNYFFSSRDTPQSSQERLAALVVLILGALASRIHPGRPDHRLLLVVHDDVGRFPVIPPVGESRDHGDGVEALRFPELHHVLEGRLGSHRVTRVVFGPVKALARRARMHARLAWGAGNPTGRCSRISRPRSRRWLSPASWRLDPLTQDHSPGAVASTRTRNVLPPSQKPYTRLWKFCPLRSTQTSTSVYGFW